MAVIHLTKDNFKEEVLESKVPVLVDFLGGMVWTVQDGCSDR